mmetsp:Transcript_5734/g.731  ORF Transcript_5734/g.731 Transcript_5734/m.731 type:complete len:81 (+) Transcript_5734:550-792(+)
MLSNIIKGRGGSLYYMAGHKAEIEGITIGRPLRDFLKKEIALYIHYNKIPTLAKFPLTRNSALPGLGSYDLLLEEFLDTL